VDGHELFGDRDQSLASARRVAFRHRWTS
jgi:hypothetical protein